MAPLRKPVGRPLKFGRPSQAVVLTLPDDVLVWLRSMHTDPARAIVALFENTNPAAPTARSASRDAELAHLPGGASLIVVDQGLLRGVQGIQLIPLADGRALLALDPRRGMADLELSVLDAAEALPPESAQRARLLALRDDLKGWRTDSSLRFETRAIIVGQQRGSGGGRRPLPRLRSESRPSERRVAPGTPTRPKD